ncbi:MAG TPA: vWA domain-containing protein [Bryobacteraceae bacterium]|nr:vWA domain-containing protein [Bryobacteraceae bacterium]
MKLRKTREQGIAILVTALSMVVVAATMGLAVDGSMLFLAKGRMSAAVDAAALAGARSLNRGLDLASQTAAATTVTEDFFHANFPDHFMGATNIAVNVSIAETGYRVRTVAVTAQAEVPTYFLQVFRISSTTVSASATSSRRDVNVMVVLDRSSSLESAGVCDTMKDSAREFVAKFAAGRDRVGLLTFGGSFRVDYAPSMDFKTDSPSIDTLISEISCSGNTGTAQALWEAYQQIVALNEPGALNLIVFFTDGLPNGITADFNNELKSSSTCKYKDSNHPKIGFIAQWANGAPTGTTAGVMNPYASSISNANETAVANSQNCSFGPPGSTQNLSKMRNDISAMPATDYYGNATTGYEAVNLTRVDLPPQIKAASANAADNAAQRIRADTNLNVVTYAIGLGGTSSEPADPVFMERVANDPLSPIFDSTRPAGLYVYAPTYAQLSQAFSKVASEILRLAQ